LWTLVIEAVIVGEYYLLFAAFGVHLPLPVLLISVVTTGLARIVPTPAGWARWKERKSRCSRSRPASRSWDSSSACSSGLHEVIWTGIGLTALMPRWVLLQRLSRTADVNT
jgi:hypothetical protein